MKKVNKIKFSPLYVVLCVILCLYVLSLVFSLGWAIITSFKTVDEFDVNVLYLPKEFVFNHKIAFDNFTVEVDYVDIHMPEMFLNSILYALGCAIMGTITPCIVGYLCAKFKYKFSSLVTMIVIVVMALPIVGNQPAEIQMARSLKIFDNMEGMWIMKMSFLGLYYFVFYSAFSSMTNSYSEAAKIDGANNYQILFKIYMPLVFSTIVTIVIIQFISYWNDYTIPMIYIPSFPTLAQGVWEFSLKTDNDLSSVPMKMAGATIMVLPTVLIFAAFSKRLMGNLNVGGVKG